MSVVVKGMKMPKECQTCPMSYCTFSGLEAVLACSELRKYVSDEEGCRDEECPLDEAEPKWIPFKTRELTDEEKEEYPEWERIFDCKLPKNGQGILVSIDVAGHERVQFDEFYDDDGIYLDSGYEIGTEAVAWMPLPEPYERGK